ncbi:MAG: type II toxin-antitoxin system RelE/ParE family toxin [Nitrospinae bacterium]|nr:type II toxin-antitoxin system RelE/ParE family toxin [Nitrospinota bacterium]
MIRGFRDRETRALFERERPRRFPPDILERAFDKLLMVDAAERLEDLRVPPGNRLEALWGARKGQHSIRVNSQWRICFRWENGAADDVELCDYH